MFSKMVSMERTPAEKVEEVMEMASPVMSVPDYPYGLTISLEEDDLEKLDLEDDCEVGDMIDLRAFARVTSVSKRQVGGKDCCRVELQIEQLAVENEDDEEPGED